MGLPRTGLHICLLLVALASCSAQFDFGGGGKKDLPPAVRSDVQYIKCSTCKLFVRQAMRTVKTMREELKPGKQVSSEVEGQQEARGAAV